MKYLKQLMIILLISFAGELLYELLPLPIPASIYGIVLLFLLLSFKVIKTEQIKDTANYLIAIMPIMFVPAAVGIIDIYDVVKSKWLSYLLLVVVSTILIMFVSGIVTQVIIKKGDKA